MLVGWGEGQGFDPPGPGGELSAFPHPNIPSQEEQQAAQATGEFEVFVEGKLVHSKKVILNQEPGQGGTGALGEGDISETFPSVPRTVMALWMRPAFRKL